MTAIPAICECCGRPLLSHQPLGFILKHASIMVVHDWCATAYVLTATTEATQ